ncbi:MAG: sodium ion-translocating decarboxylase subunit beta [Lactobacillales bacterium]|jgi:oxaloacetate decarboxylase beta subunit|nr:sodium ion-translocating decarboxylase subunit beta [Lactobacillales bacterium]
MIKPIFKSLIFRILFIAALLAVVGVSFSNTDWFNQIWAQTGLNQFNFTMRSENLLVPIGIGQLIMMGICFLLLYLGIAKGVEPLLLIPIATGGILSNIPGAELTAPGGILYILYAAGIETGLFPLFIFLGLGAMIDFSPMLANPKTALLGGAAQFAIFGTFLGALALGKYLPVFEVTMGQAASIAIIGGADGPTSIFLSSKLAPELLGAVAVAAYSYMALIPIIQPPLMRLCTTQKERQIEMRQLRPVSKKELVLFPIVVIVMTGLFIPSALPLIGMLMFGNLIRESGVADILAKACKDVIVPVTTIFLGVCIGSKLSADLFLNRQTMIVLLLGVVAFGVGTVSGILMAKLMNVFSRDKVNPLIGSAGVSAIPMAARISEKLGLQANPHNHLIMHAMGANVSGSIGSALAAGILLALCQ